MKTKSMRDHSCPESKGYYVTCVCLSFMEEQKSALAVAEVRQVGLYQYHFFSVAVERCFSQDRQGCVCMDVATLGSSFPWTACGICILLVPVWSMICVLWENPSQLSGYGETSHPAGNPYLHGASTDRLQAR